MGKNAVRLVIIDPQNDFIDLPAGSRPVIDGIEYTPTLQVGGAYVDMLRVAKLINEAQAHLSGIAVTLDTHHRMDIGHHVFWDAAPFTQITWEDVYEGRQRPRNLAFRLSSLDYLCRLEAVGRKHMAWPVHCELGTFGHNVVSPVKAAYQSWEQATHSIVLKVIKGLSPGTESYSAVQAEVPDQTDPSTQRNEAFVAWCADAGLTLLAGEAGSHCVKETVEDLVEGLTPEQLARYVLLVDCMSPVPGFEAVQAAFIADMRSRGMRIATAQEMIDELTAGQ